MFLSIENEPGPVPKIQDGLTVEEKMDMWGLQSEDGTSSQSFDFDEVDEFGDKRPETLGDQDFEEDEEDDYATEKFPIAQKFLLESAEYCWLTTRLKTELILSNRKGTIIEDIRHQILSTVITQSRENCSGSIYQAEFLLEWNPIDFIKQQFPDKKDQPLGTIIVICGSEINAQTMTCAQYMDQMWPESGKELLLALEDFMIKEDRTLCQCKHSPHKTPRLGVSVLMSIR